MGGVANSCSFADNFNTSTHGLDLKRRAAPLSAEQEYATSSSKKLSLVLSAHPVLLLSELWSDVLDLWSAPVEYWQCLHVTLKSHFYRHINRGRALYTAFATVTLLCRPSCPSFHRRSPPLFVPLFCPPGIGSPSFQRSSIWTRSWRTRSKALKTSWPPRATRDRVSSLTSTVCEWQCVAESGARCWRCEWRTLCLRPFVSACPFFIACSQTWPGCAMQGHWLLLFP